MLHRVILTERAHAIAAEHLLSGYNLNGYGDEDMCFAVWYPSTGQQTQTALVDNIILPEPGERRQDGNVSFESSFLRRAFNDAYNRKAGLALMHSHPCDGWQGMSRDDIVAERDVILPFIKPLKLPLVGMTLGTDHAWSARFWEKRGSDVTKHHCERVNVVGANFCTTLHPNTPPFEWREEFKRTVSTWGENAQNALAKTKFGIIGVGSVGCFVAESLARMGIEDITLIDPDKVERHNLDRLLYATSSDIGKHKVCFFAEQLKKSTTAKKDRSNIRAIPYSVHKTVGFKAALDCDILFCCVDKPRGRNILNHIAMAHVIPVFEGGILATRRDGKMGRPSWQTHTVYPGTRCLFCHGQYDMEEVDAEVHGIGENLSYIQDVGADKHGMDTDSLHRKEAPNENVFAFSAHLASTQVLQMLRHVVGHGWVVNLHTRFSYRSNKLSVDSLQSCKQGCKFPKREAQGDQATDHLISAATQSTDTHPIPVGFWRRILSRILRQGH